jgi:hypothetical protein
MGSYEEGGSAVHRAGHSSDGEKTTSVVRAEEQAALVTELEEALREAVTALRVCGCPSQDRFLRVWRHAQEKAQRVLAKVQRRSR